MIAVPPGVRILLAARPVDFRKGMDGLAALVQQALRADPFAGEVFIFRPKRADRVKILVYDQCRSLKFLFCSLWPAALWNILAIQSLLEWPSKVVEP